MSCDPATALSSLSETARRCQKKEKEREKKKKDQIPHVLTYKWELNHENTWTHRENNTHWGLWEGKGGGRESIRTAKG